MTRARLWREGVHIVTGAVVLVLLALIAPAESVEWPWGLDRPLQRRRSPPGKWYLGQVRSLRVPAGMAGSGEPRRFRGPERFPGRIDPERRSAR